MVRWLARLPGAGEIRVDANDTAWEWNGKRMLHPTSSPPDVPNGQVANSGTGHLGNRSIERSEAFKRWGTALR